MTVLLSAPSFRYELFRCWCSASSCEPTHSHQINVINLCINVSVEGCLCPDVTWKYDQKMDWRPLSPQWNIPEKIYLDVCCRMTNVTRVLSELSYMWPLEINCQTDWLTHLCQIWHLSSNGDISDIGFGEHCLVPLLLSLSVVQLQFLVCKTAGNSL